MKHLLILATMLLSFGFANAQSKIIQGEYTSGKVIARVSNDKLIQGEYTSGKVIARVVDDTIKSVGDFGEIVEYEGPYKKLIEIDCGDISTCYYKINGNTISMVDNNGKIQYGCESEGIPCTTELFKF